MLKVLYAKYSAKNPICKNKQACPISMKAFFHL